MNAKTDWLPQEEVGRRADEIFEALIARHITDENPRWYVLIDVMTSAYEVDANTIAASDRLMARHPEAQVWMRRVGSRYACRFGWRGQFIKTGEPVHRTRTGTGSAGLLSSESRSATED